MGESLLRLTAVLDRTGHSRSSWYAEILAGRAPRPVKRGKASLWLESEVQAVIDRDAATLPRSMGRMMGRRRKTA
jgi:predicted DNA-binding transcriptional regulator AlpA